MTTGRVYPFQSDDDIRSEARDWVLKFNADTPPADADIMALREWAKRSPTHRAELARATAFWCDADVLTALAVPTDANRTRPGSFARFSGLQLTFNYIGALAAILIIKVVIINLFW